jgi:hypothetical protein
MISVVVPVAVVAISALGLVPSPALAQDSGGGNPAISVQQAHPAETSMHYFVKLASKDGKGDPIDGATITATPTKAGGSAGTPSTLQADGSGIYEGSVPLSKTGSWTITFASTNPEATLSYEQKMPGEVFDATDDSSSSPLFPILFAVAFFVALLGMGAWALIDRRRAAADAGTGADTEVDADA